MSDCRRGSVEVAGEGESWTIDYLFFLVVDCCSFVPEANKPATNPTTLSEACAVVDVLGDEVR